MLQAEQPPLEEAAEVGGIVVPEDAVEWPVAVDGVAHKDVVAVDVQVAGMVAVAGEGVVAEVVVVAGKEAVAEVVVVAGKEAVAEVVVVAVN